MLQKDKEIRNLQARLDKTQQLQKQMQDQMEYMKWFMEGKVVADAEPPT